MIKHIKASFEIERIWNDVGMNCFRVPSACRNEVQLGSRKSSPAVRSDRASGGGRPRAGPAHLRAGLAPRRPARAAQLRDHAFDGRGWNATIRLDVGGGCRAGERRSVMLGMSNIFWKNIMSDLLRESQTSFGKTCFQKHLRN